MALARSCKRTAQDGADALARMIRLSALHRKLGVAVLHSPARDRVHSLTFASQTMKFRMHENSLFAILLRSPWWISIAIAGGIAAVAAFLVPVTFAAAAAAPFLVIGGIAGWRQLRAPSATRIEQTVAVVRAMSWSDFADALEGAFRRDGYAVSRLDGATADFEITKAGRTSLVGCKRWKAARTGVEPLRDLDAARRARELHDCIYVATGEFTDGARTFATDRNIRVLHGAELAKLLPRVGHG
jgi:restriction system protein